MTKIYDIIYLNNQMYAVDKKISLKGNYLTDGVAIYEPSEIRDKVILKGEEHLHTKVSAIVASTDPSLGLPLIPTMVEDDTRATSYNLWEEYGRPVDIVNFQRIFNLGYKAPKAKKYTEEDMRVAFIAGRKFQQGGKSADIRKGGEPERNEPDFNIFIQSLNPLPKQVEVEMENAFNETYGEIRGYYPKTNDDKHIVVKKWIYE